MATQFASRLALIVFAASAIDQLQTSDLSATLSSVLLSTAVFYGLGLVCGELARRVAEEDAQREFDSGNAAMEQQM